MKTKNQISIIFLLLLFVILPKTESVLAQESKVISSEKGPIHTHKPDEPCVPPEYYKQLHAEIESNVERLAAEGKLMVPQGGLAPQKFDWPLAHETHFYGNEYFFIQNYIDHAPGSGVISEYMCGTRSYDLPSGYNHQGTDICIGPYWWNMMDDMKVRIVAAAPGQIVGRVEGNFDRNCGFGGGSANSITIQHADGTRALYVHMKNGSVTPKLVGDFVTTGEYLGYVGSSGNSTNPHLHFEVQDTAGIFIDPWQGPCNNDIIQSLWNDQKPYPNTGIMSILTMWANPVVPACPTPETENLSNHFDQGAFVRVEVHLRDLIAGSTSVTRIYNPSGNVFLTWNDTIDNFAAGNWYGFTFNLPNNAPVGTYKIYVEYDDKKAAHYFTVGCPGAYNLSGVISGYRGYITGENITTTQTIGASSGNNIWYEAADYIQANVGFRATKGSRFRARIDNCAENTTIARLEPVAQQSFSLQATPTITKNQTKINLEMIQRGTVSITVHDLTGRKIKSVITDQNMDMGKHEFDLSVTEFISGIYIISAQSGESKAQCKIVVQQ